MKDTEIKIKEEIEELFIKLIIISIDDMDRSEKEEMKVRPVKDACIIG